jgi:hypothetical protein
MQTYKKDLLKSGAQIYSGMLLLKIAKAQRMQKMIDLQQAETIQSTPPVNNYDYGFYESTVIKLMGVIASFMEAILKDGVEVDPFLMKEATELLNGLQELIDIKKGK